MVSTLDLRAAMSESGTFIYEDLKKSILTFQLMPGENVTENNLAAKYGTSRATIRPILKRLESETLIHVIPQKGSFVTYLDYDYIKSIMFIRLQVEYEALRRLTEQLPATVQERFTRTLEREKNITCVSAEGYYSLETEFHRIIFDTLPVTGVGERIEQLDESCKRYRLLRYQCLQKTPQILYEEHLKLYQKICSCDPDAVFHCFREYIYGDIDAMEDILEENWDNYFLKRRKPTEYV